MKISNNVITIFVFVTFIFLAFLLTLRSYDIEYDRLASSILHAKTYHLLPNLLDLSSMIILTLMGALLLLSRYSNTRTPSITLLLLVNLYVFAICSFFIQGALISPDQPRVEMALGTMIVDGKLSGLEEAEKVSSYFRWPGLWIYVGIFSALTTFSPLEAPVYIMLVIWLLLGITLMIIVKHIYAKVDPLIATTPFLLYAILNPYKVLHLCPHVYALVLFMVIVSALIRETSSWSFFVTVKLLAVVIIMSHPLTSIIVVGLLISFIIIKIFEKRQLTALPKSLVFSVSIFFTLWNIRFEDNIYKVVLELTEGSPTEPLSPTAGDRLYLVDAFYMTMTLFRYIGLCIIASSAIISLYLHKNNKKVRMGFFITSATFLSSFPLSFVPGTFFHRLLYYTSLPAVVLATGAIYRLAKFVVRGTRSVIVLALIMITLPLLAQASIAEYLTNNDPSISLTNFSDIALSSFIGKFYSFSGLSWSITTPSMRYFVTLYQGKNLYPYTIIIEITPLVTKLSRYLVYQNSTAIREYVNVLYSGNYFIVSPKEKYVFYRRTLFADFNVIDRYIDSLNNKIYDDKLLKLYARD